MSNPPLMATHTRRRKCQAAPLGEGSILFSLDEYLSPSSYAVVRNRPLRSLVGRDFSRAWGGRDDCKLR